MHRCAEHGLKVDEDGLTLDPSEIDRRLRVLASYFYGDERDARYLPTLCEALDPVKLEEARMWRRAYLGRYMRQPMHVFDEMPVSEIREYVRIVSEMLKAEAGPVTQRHETNWV